MKPSLAFFDAKPYDREFFESANKAWGYRIKYLETKLNPDTAGFAQGYDVVCSFVNDTVNRETLDVLVKCGVKLLALRCAGYNHIDLKAAYGRIPVVHVPEYSPYAVAEHALALILALNRKIHKAYHRTRDGDFTLNGLMGFDMHGKTAAVIGTGRIGMVMLKMLKGFDMRLVAFDPYPNMARAAEIGFEYLALDELYGAAEIISLHCPLTPQNVHLINSASIAKMKDGVILVNTSRGRLIDSRGLVEGLKSGKIGGAALDVYEEEAQYFFEDYSSTVIGDDVLARLLTFPNVLITAHQGFFTREALSKIAEVTLENIRLFFEKRELPHEICYHCGTGTCRKKTEGRCWTGNLPAK